MQYQLNREAERESQTGGLAEMYIDIQENMPEEIQTGKSYRRNMKIVCDNEIMTHLIMTHRL